MTKSVDELIRLLGLRPHPEGGFFAETYRSEANLPPDVCGSSYPSARPLATAIYYLLTPETFSEMHRLPGDEIFHFYMGDPVEMLQLFPDGSGLTVRIGVNVAAGERPQVVVPKGVWQGSRLVSGTLAGARHGFALLGTTLSPGFDYQDYCAGNRDELVRAYPQFRDLIVSLTR